MNVCKLSNLINLIKHILDQRSFMSAGVTNSVIMAGWDLGRLMYYISSEAVSITL